MSKYEKLSEAFTLLNIAFRRLMDLKEGLRKDLKTLLIVNSVKEIEEIKDHDMLKLALDLEAQMEKITTQAEKLSEFMDELIDIRIF